MALKHVLWIGGPPGAGKTTVATRIARRHGLRWYGADTRTWEHRDRAIAEGNSAAISWEAMRPDERGKTRPAELLAMSLHRERGRMIVDDLERLPDSPLIVAEGSPVSPAVVAKLGAAASVWLIPTPEFQRARIQSTLYELLAAEIEREANEHAVPLLTVDGSRGIDETVKAVEELFAEPLATGPRAETPAERRALLREANEAIAEQVRGYYARPWADGDAESVVREFICECGAPGCDGWVEAQVSEAAAGPLTASGHDLHERE